MISSRTWLSFFAVKDQKFHQRGIMKLPESWQKVIEQNGRYLIFFVYKNEFYFTLKTEIAFLPTQYEDF